VTGPPGVQPGALGEANPTDGKAAVRLEDVRFGYGENEVIQCLSLDVQRGELLAVVGQNGCGKTTLMKLIAGLYQPWQGTVRIGDKATQWESPLGRVGYVFQYPEHQFVAQTVEQELLFGLRQRKGEQEKPRRRAEETLRLFGLWKKREQSPYSLSMGEKRLLSVATMVILEPEILILDEPTTGLDRRSTEYLMDILRTLVQERGITLIQVTHDMEQVAEHATRAIVLDDGRVVFDGTPRELFLAEELLRESKLQAPPVVELSKELWGARESIPITVQQLMEVRRACLRVSGG
jgi:energy-coupling factor transport system ATP-binding protein